jgi:hypothetical protein
MLGHGVRMDAHGLYCYTMGCFFSLVSRPWSDDDRPSSLFLYHGPALLYYGLTFYTMEIYK